MDIVSNIIFGFPILLGLYLLCMLIIVQVKKDTSIANYVWGGGVLLITLYTYFVFPLLALTGSEKSPWLRWRSLLVTVLIILWAGRLILYVYLRYKGEDPRYQSWKLSGLKALIINIGYIFILQVIMMLIMSVPSYLINEQSGFDLTYLDFIGLAIWLIGYYWEAASDYQLFKFTSNPANKGKVMRYGLWRYSRHPNYFGEILMWWGIFLIAWNVSIFAIVAPVTITFLLLFVTGIPWVEKAMAKNPEYQEYKKHTNIFIPWFPK